jgi:mannuronan synthase
MKEPGPDFDELHLSRGVSLGWGIGIGLGLLALVLLGRQAAGPFGQWMIERRDMVLTLGAFAAWRWSWWLFQTTRAVYYRYVHYPRLKQAAEQAVIERGPVPEVNVIIVTYKEEPWLTRLVFLSLLKELSTLEGLVRPPKLIAVTGDEKDDCNILAAYQELALESRSPVELILLRGDEGKRAALVKGLSRLADTNPDPDGVTLLMDGDTDPNAGTVAALLPFFRLNPPVDAVTTNETVRVKGPAWFHEWLLLRFGMRHRAMCSIALSGKLLCLTGRLSGFRTSVAVNSSFMELIGNDQITHWLWGRFKMLSGDDKSTWFWLMRQGGRMLYLCDATAVTYEVVPCTGIRRAVANIRRWSGNMLRNNDRAVALGPRRIGWFTWWSILDQRICIWTVLIGPIGALWALWHGVPELACGYLAWVVTSRTAHASVAWKHGRRISPIYIPLQILTEWTSSIVKMWVLFHPAKQKWMNRGNRQLDSSALNPLFRLRGLAALHCYTSAVLILVFSIGVYIGFKPLRSEIILMTAPWLQVRDAQTHGRGSSPQPVESKSELEVMNYD